MLFHSVTHWYGSTWTAKHIKAYFGVSWNLALSFYFFHQSMPAIFTLDFFTLTDIRNLPKAVNTIVSFFHIFPCTWQEASLEESLIILHRRGNRHFINLAFCQFILLPSPPFPPLVPLLCITNSHPPYWFFTLYPELSFFPYWSLFSFSVNLPSTFLKSCLLPPLVVLLYSCSVYFYVHRNTMWMKYYLYIQLLC